LHVAGLGGVIPVEAKMRNFMLLLAALVAPVFAQGPEPVVYKADFLIRDSTDTAAKAARKYTIVVNRAMKGTFRVGNRVPISTEPGSKSFQYVDIGVNIECIVQEAGGKISMHADLDMSTASQGDKNPGGNPTISQIRVNIDTAISPGKPVVVAAFDDPLTSRKFEVEATVTRVN
jgi:hypothetical protein